MLGGQVCGGLRGGAKINFKVKWGKLQGRLINTSSLLDYL